ncbi:hypothetical protein [Duganella sp. HH101]|uniref:hypothetical protein n=1 Tax=Duganella sp. HH101 TaxID=1781066 RepID=UPI001E2E89FD|nr:hypothetical protein [Duganella sp. HH101]
MKIMQSRPAERDATEMRADIAHFGHFHLTDLEFMPNPLHTADWSVYTHVFAYPDN